MKLKRALATGAAIVIAGFSLTACGDDDSGGNGGGNGGGGNGSDAGDAPDDATTEEFCGALSGDSLGGGEGDSAEEQADAAHEVADKLAEVGTPEGMDESARNGFEVFVEFLSEVDADDMESFATANPADPEALAESLGIDKEEAADVITFITTSAQECVPSMEDLPSDTPTE